MKTQVSVITNSFGFFVGCITYSNGVVAQVTNPKHTEAAARAVAERMASSADRNEVVAQ